jgi:hypothetical protein
VTFKSLNKHSYERRAKQRPAADIRSTDTQNIRYKLPEKSVLHLVHVGVSIILGDWCCHLYSSYSTSISRESVYEIS